MLCKWRVWLVGWLVGWLVLRHVNLYWVILYSNQFNCYGHQLYSKKVSKVGDRSRGQLEGPLFNSYYTKMSGRTLLLSLDSSTLPLIRTLYCWVLSKVVSITIFWVFAMTRPGIEPRSPRPLANTLPISPMSRYQLYTIQKYIFTIILDIKTLCYIKQIYLTHRWDPNKYYHSGSEWTSY